jgi:hypothetical protein
VPIALAMLPLPMMVTSVMVLPSAEGRRHGAGVRERR